MQITRLPVIFTPVPTASSEQPGPNTPTAPPATEPPQAPGGSSAPPPIQPGEVSSKDKPSAPRPGEIQWLPTSTTTITRTWDVPVLHSQSLGRIPADFYQPALNPWNPWTGGGGIYYPIGVGGTFGYGEVDVVRDVPEYNADGTPRMQSVTKTLTETTYNQKNRTIGFGIGAAVAGAGAAALVGVAEGTGAGPVGMIVGGLLGAAAGAAIGYKSAIGDKVYEQWMTDTISHPTLVGYTQWTTPDYRTEYEHHTVRDAGGHEHDETTQRQELLGWWMRYDPEIHWRDVGSYKYPTLQHSGKVGAVGGSFLAIGAGALLGAGAGFLTTLL